MRGLGLGVEMQEAAPGRPNVIGVLDGGEPGRTLMLCGHIDTVGVDGMSAPFDPVERDGRLYGRGSQDMKGGVAAMIDAARLARDRGFRKGRLIVAAVVDEEYASLGADTLVTKWSADAAIVTEPTDLQIGVGHKGFAWAAIETRGRAAHGSRPRDGRDAILRMGRVLRALEQCDRELQSRAPHPVMGTASLHASIIDGGRELSSYPDRCRLQMERRTVVGETAESFMGGDRADPRHAATGGSRVRRLRETHVLASPVRAARRARASPGARACGRPGRSHRRNDRDELLDRRGDSWRVRNPVRLVRAWRRRAAQHRRIRRGQGRDRVSRRARRHLALTWL